MILLKFIKKIYYLFLEKKKKIYLNSLENKGLKIGKNVNIMDACFFDPSHCFLISIGDDTTLAPNVRLIAHDASTKHDLGYSRVGKIRIGNECFIGDSVIVLPGVTIGDKAIIAAGAIVTKDIPPGSIAAGNPCKVILNQELFVKKHGQQLDCRMVPYSDIDQEKLNALQKEAVLNFLESGTGYTR